MLCQIGVVAVCVDGNNHRPSTNLLLQEGIDTLLQALYRKNSQKRGSMVKQPKTGGGGGGKKGGSVFSVKTPDSIPT